MQKGAPFPFLGALSPGARWYKLQPVWPGGKGSGLDQCAPTVR